MPLTPTVKVRAVSEVRVKALNGIAAPTVPVFHADLTPEATRPSS
ncbi:Uncharacterised protein [Mycobacteroides abscessus]|nr:Uncharacterised protein [Mycobacteroides abscessus]